MYFHSLFWIAAAIVFSFRWYFGNPVLYVDILMLMIFWGMLLFDYWFDRRRYLAIIALKRSHSFAFGYNAALRDIEDLDRRTEGHFSVPKMAQVLREDVGKL